MDPLIALHHGPHGGTATPEAPNPSSAHPPVVGDDAGCLELLAERMRAMPGVLALEADFRSGTLTVR